MVAPSSLHALECTVHKGDTVFSISQRYHVTIADLKTANRRKIKTQNRLYVGEKLFIPVTASPSSTMTKAPKLPPSSPREEIKSGDREEISESKVHYLFIDKIMDKLEAPRVVPDRWKYIVVHHSGTKSGNARIFDYFHRNIRGMENGLAYHFVIGNGHDSGDGEIEVGNRWLKQLQGGHLASEALNQVALGICFVGDFNHERPTKKQIAAAIELITYLNHRCGKQPIFKAHREINPKPTDCPGKYFPVQAFHQLFDISS